MEEYKKITMHVLQNPENMRRRPNIGIPFSRGLGRWPISEKIREIKKH